MRKLFLATLLLVVILPTLALKKASSYLEARKSGALAKIQIHIVDDIGHNVPDAAVSVFMGMNFRPKGYYLKGMTDTNGIYVIEGKTCGDEIVIDVTKQGHYSSAKKLSFAEMGRERDVKDNKWQPFGQHEKIILRRIVNPVKLVAFDKLIDIVQTNVWLGFDMEKMDFISPIGNGRKVDFEIRAEWDGLPAWKSKCCSAEIRFVGYGTGGYYVENVLESTFPYIYEAQSDSLYTESNIRIVDRNGDMHTTKIPFERKSSFVTRIRSIVDENGKIKAANYGCIRQFEIGPSRRGVVLCRLSYIFNPTPNDRNLEWDMKNNLHPNPGDLGKLHP